MQTMIRALLLTLFVSAVLCQSFNGVWTDDSTGGFGGDLYICVDDGDLYGMYSEVGIVVGTVSDDGVAVGRWYEGGQEGCISGNFEWTLDGDSFTGFWTCDGNQTPVQHDWSESRTSEDNPTTKQCARLARRGPVDGHWFSGTAANGGVTYDICTDDDSYEASYFFVNNAGYETGYADEGGRVAGGAFYGRHGLGVLPGSSLWFHLADGTNGNTWWLSFNTPDIDNIDNNDVHGYDTYVLNYGTTEGKCDRFADFEDDYVDYFGYESFWDESSSSAAYLAVPVCMLLATLVVML